MKETEFLALMHCGQYVDANLLHKGIYTCSKPFIYSKEETIGSIIRRGKIMKDMLGQNAVPDKYFESLGKCELVKILITETI